MMPETPVTGDVKQKIASIVKDTLAERFDPDSFVFDPIIVEPKIVYFPDEDYEYIDILIVFHGTIEQLDHNWTVGLIRRILPKMEAEGIYVKNYPGKGFVEKAEWDYLQEHGWPESEIFESA